jgi:hypothetical protein
MRSGSADGTPDVVVVPCVWSVELTDDVIGAGKVRVNVVVVSVENAIN